MPCATSPSSDDDVHDRPSSDTSTPPGMHTPQPDPSDKRSPGLINSFYAQVRAASGSDISQRTPLPASSNAPPILDCLSHPQSDAAAELPTDSSSISESIVVLDRHRASDPSADDLSPGSQSETEHLVPSSNQTSPASPSLSPTCSLLQTDCEEAENGAPSTSGVAFIYRALKNFIRPSDSVPKTDRTVNLPAPTACAVSTVESSSNSAAASDCPGLPTPSPYTQLQLPPSPAFSKPHSDRPEMLTDVPASELRTKNNTPPMTPRTMSNEAPEQAVERPPPELRDESVNDDTPPVESSSSDSSSASSGSTERPRMPGGSVKGKLSVQITEGRGLRPSFDPYVVCVFELNEYISEGARTAEELVPEDPVCGDPSGGVPIQRSDSVSNRTKAIPAKVHHHPKRQSQITDPLWNHEAVLFVPP